MYYLLYKDCEGYYYWDKFETLSECAKEIEKLIKNGHVYRESDIDIVCGYNVEFGVETQVQVYTYDSKEFVPREES